MDIRRSGFSTKVVHAGQHPCRLTGALATPIYQTSTFSLDRLAETRYVYTRVGNPTNTVLEEKMAILESGERSLAFSSGMAAISATIFSLASKGDHIITDNVIYGCTYDLLSSMPRFGIEVSFVDASDVSKVEGCMKGNTKLIFLERHEKNALEIAMFLEDHPKVKRVLYPGLESHPQHELAKRQMEGFGGMLALELRM
jgi:methionine-gamma-lyase